ncbi:alpha/beta fold hydrolase [Herbaspirillum frisingense]|uniref:alpha/beta fold hydrolase n=1 Tax=Herbaspirillum frisingense TaxID=92645 RepID=UPI0039AEAF35
MQSSFLYGANILANGIRQHYLRFGGKDGARAGRDAVIIVPGITSPAVTWGFVGERFGQQFDTYVLDVRGLTRLVMVDPPVSGPGRRAYPSKLPWYVDSMRLAREGCSAEQMRAFCPTWTEQQLQLRAEWLHTCDERAVIASFEGFHTDDFHADLPALKLPVMLMQASRGDVILPEDVQELQGLLPQLVVSRVEDAGHMIPWDNEAGFYAAFGDFLGAPL